MKKKTVRDNGKILSGICFALIIGFWCIATYGGLICDRSTSGRYADGQFQKVLFIYSANHRICQISAGRSTGSPDTSLSVN